MPDCPKCGYEDRYRIFSSPCPKCQHVFYDTEEYVRMLAGGLHIESCMDIGCGNKGIIAEAYWVEQDIERAYAVDRHVIKDGLNPVWQRLLMDAEDLPKLGIAVDFTTHCGLLEHLEYDKAFKVLHAIEQVTTKRVFASASAMMREVDSKVKADGNPFHYYRSFWPGPVLTALGYTVDQARMARGETFYTETTFWYDPQKLEQPFHVRELRALDALLRTRCEEPLCGAQPALWDPTRTCCWCVGHALQQCGYLNDYDRGSLEKLLCCAGGY